MLVENVDYELIPVENDEHWQIRIKRGEFIETVFQFGKLKVENEYLHFDYNLIYSPIDELTEQNESLQNVVKDILFSVMESAIGSENAEG